jgi:hypothetical protein
MHAPKRQQTTRRQVLQHASTLTDLHHHTGLIRSDRTGRRPRDKDGQLQHASISSTWATAAPNIYDNPYDYTKIYAEFYIVNYIAKVYINMVFIDIFVNTAVVYNQNTTTCRRCF